MTYDAGHGNVVNVPDWSPYYNDDYNVDNTSSAAVKDKTAEMSDMDLLKYELDYNSAEARKDRDWQKMMSDTSFQRAIADVKAAGYNPWLLLDRGSGASTPGGSSATASSGIYSAKKQRDSAKEQNASKYVGMFVAAAAMLIAAAL